MSGAKDDGVATPAGLFPESLIWAIVSVFIVGIGAIIGLMAVMKEVVGFDPHIILVITLLTFMLMALTEGVLIWQLLRRKSGAKEGGDIERQKERETKGLGAAQPRALPEPMPSVTEHTTRTFEPIYTERKSK